MTLYPIVWTSEKLTRLIARGNVTHTFSRDEFVAMARLGHKSGRIRDNESRIIRNLFRFGSLKAMDVMTPRNVVSALPEETTVLEAEQAPEDHICSPACRFTGRSLMTSTGFVLRDDVLLSKGSGRHGKKLKSLRREIMAVPETVSLPKLLDTLLEHRQHIALVVDEYGDTRGLVTLEDLVETLLGVEIVDEMDTVDNMRELARKQWKTRAEALGIEDEHAQ